MAVPGGLAEQETEAGCLHLDNLLPVCTHHHTRIHHDSWHLTLGPNRELTIRTPDGTIHNTGPPTRTAA